MKTQHSKQPAHLLRVTLLVVIATALVACDDDGGMTEPDIVTAADVVGAPDGTSPDATGQPDGTSSVDMNSDDAGDATSSGDLMSDGTAADVGTDQVSPDTTSDGDALGDMAGADLDVSDVLGDGDAAIGDIAMGDMAMGDMADDGDAAMGDMADDGDAAMGDGDAVMDMTMGCGASEYESAPGVCTPLTDCTAGGYVSTPATATSDRQCADCASGSYSNTTNATMCTACGAGTFNMFSGATSCTPCQPGSWSQMGATMCNLCPTGRFASGSGATNCESCDPGTYAPGSGNTSCMTCSGGTYSGGSAGMCANCAPGTFSSAGASACTQCSAGTAAPAGGSTTCTQCVAGTYAGVGAATCTACPSGSFSDVNGATLCSECDPGTFADSAGQTLCSACPVGTFADMSGTVSCAQHTTCTTNATETQAGTSSTDTVCTCDAGFADPESDGACTECASGYYNYPGCEEPAVSGGTPADADTGVDPVSTIEVWFVTAMDGSTLTTQSTFGACAGTIQVSVDDFTSCIALGAPAMSAGDTVATLTPTPSLSPGQTYKVRVTTGAQTADGTPLASEYVMATGFTTAAYPSCPGLCSATVNESGDALEADYCVIQFPTTVMTTVGSSVTIYSRIYEAGVTESAGDSGSIVAEIGYGPASLNPATEIVGWTWLAATFNIQSGNDDEYQATIASVPLGDSQFVARFSLDSGTTWTYCDINGSGSNAGLAFDVGDTGVMVATP